MKTEIATKYKFVLGFVGMVMTFWSCTNEINDLGKNLLPTGDLIHVRTYSEKNIKAYTVSDGNQRTDEPASNLLGTFNDPKFGKTTADFACQFRLTGYPDFPKDTKIDSLVLYMYYKEVYGDLVTPQKLKVYELNSDLDVNQKYYQDINLKSISAGEVLGEKNYLPKFKLDSLTSLYGSTKKDPKDTTIQTIAIKLSPTLTQKLMSADEATLKSNDLFIKFFKGLYIEAGDLNQGGSVMKISPRFGGPYLVLHYHETINGKDSLKTYTYNVNQTSSARVSRFTHDYSKTDFFAHLDKTDVQDTSLFLQTTGGLRTKILIPNLGTWKDSTDFAINKAELVFTLDPALSDTLKYLPAEQLVFSAIGIEIDKDKKEREIKYLPSDFAFSSAYYGGTYNPKDKTYRFNIANHLQDLIEGKKGKENLGFYLATSSPSSTFRRVVLKGVTSKTGIRLDITYSKIR